MERRNTKSRRTASRNRPLVMISARSAATSNSHEASSGPRTQCAPRTAAVATPPVRGSGQSDASRGVHIHVLSLHASASEQVPVTRLDGYQTVRVLNVYLEAKLGSSLARQLPENSFDVRHGGSSILILTLMFLFVGTPRVPLNKSLTVTSPVFFEPLFTCAP